MTKNKQISDEFEIKKMKKRIKFRPTLYWIFSMILFGIGILLVITSVVDYGNGFIRALVGISMMSAGFVLIVVCLIILKIKNRRL